MDKAAEDIREAIGKIGSISKEYLADILKKLHPEITNEKTLAWRIHDLKQKGVITHVARGWYAVSDKKSFEPTFSDQARSIWNNLDGVLAGDPKLCLTETSWLNEWSLHQSFANRIVIEPEKKFAEIAFRELRYHFANIYYDPDPKTFDLQIVPDNTNVIVQPLISEAPVEKGKEIVFSSLEKILVDLLCDTVYEEFLEEADDIYREAFSQYLINQPRMHRYARRRNVAEKINKLIHDNTGHLQH